MNISQLKEIKKNMNIDESVKTLELGLIYLAIHKTISTKELAKLMKVPVPIATAFKKELLKTGWMKRESFYYLTKESKDMILKEFNLENITLELYKSLLLHDKQMEIFLNQIMSSFKYRTTNRPVIKLNFDQAFATVDTVKDRVKLLLKNPLIFSEKIVFLGDDDLTSLFLASALYQLGDRRDNALFVYDIDKELIDYINDFYPNALQVHAEYQDFRLPMANLDNHIKADIILTDPPYTEVGVIAFIKIADQLLNKNGIAYLSYSHKSPTMQQSIQAQLINLGFHFLKVVPNFNNYMGGSIIGNQSNLYVLQKSELSISEKSTDGIYTANQKNKTNQILGFHTLFEVKSCDSSILKDVENVKKIMNDLVSQFSLNKVDENFHQFSPYGVSGVIILAESHFTVHTWPEYDYAAIDLFVCSDAIDEDEFAGSIIKKFKAQNCLYKKINRKN